MKLESYYDHDNPDLRARLNVSWNRPVDYLDLGGDGWARVVPRGRTRLTIEGESGLVERVFAAAKPVVDEIHGEIAQ